MGTRLAPRGGSTRAFGGNLHLKSLVAAAAAAGSLSLASTAGATNYTMYLHGMSLFVGCGDTPSGWCYWGGGGQPGVNAVPVNYDGTAHISQAAVTVQSALDAYCMGSSWCYVAGHSEGGAMIGYLEAVYPGRWNIYWVDIAGSAAGGSDLADAADWAIGSGTVSAICGACSDLATGPARGLYNHDALGDYISGYVYTDVGGGWSTWDTCFFPGGGWACPVGPTPFQSGGGNDRVVAYHSSAHYRSWGIYSTASANGATGGDYWDYTMTNYVDNDSSGTYTHFIGSGGITSVMTSIMSSYAQ
jgi:hypothetical protein